MQITARERAQRICFMWAAHDWGSYEDWLHSESGLEMWEPEIACIIPALKEHAAQAVAEALALEVNGES